MSNRVGVLVVAALALATSTAWAQPPDSVRYIRVSLQDTDSVAVLDGEATSGRKRLECRQVLVSLDRHVLVPLRASDDAKAVRRLTVPRIRVDLDRPLSVPLRKGPARRVRTSLD